MGHRHMNSIPKRAHGIVHGDQSQRGKMALPPTLGHMLTSPLMRMRTRPLMTSRPSPMLQLLGLWCLHQARRVWRLHQARRLHLVGMGPHAPDAAGDVAPWHYGCYGAEVARAIEATADAEAIAARPPPAVHIPRTLPTPPPFLERSRRGDARARASSAGGPSLPHSEAAGSAFEVASADWLLAGADQDLAWQRKRQHDMDTHGIVLMDNGGTTI